MQSIEIIKKIIDIWYSFMCSRKLKSAPHFPTHYPEESQEPIADEYWSDSVHKFADPSILFEENR